MTRPYPAFFSVRAWTNDTKTTELTQVAGVTKPITTVTNFTRNEKANMPDTFTISCPVQDVRAAALGGLYWGENARGAWIEVWAGREPQWTPGLHIVSGLQIHKVDSQHVGMTAGELESPIAGASVAISSVASSSIHALAAGVWFVDLDYLTNALAYTQSATWTADSVRVASVRISGSGTLNSITDLRGGRTLIADGYVQKVQKDNTRPGTSSVTFVDALQALAYYRCMDDLLMGPPHYLGLGNFLTGPDGPRDPDNPDPPGKQAILPPTWSKEWIDGTDWKQNLKTLGLGDTLYSALESALFNLGQLASHYGGILFRCKRGSSNIKGTAQIGPFHRDSGLHVYGGKPLHDRLVAMKLQQDWEAHGNADLAQLAGMAVVGAVAYEDDLTNVANVVWAPGVGSKAGGYHTLHYWWKDGDPIELYNLGQATKWQPIPGGQVYYIYGTLSGSAYTAPFNDDNADTRGVAHWMGEIFRLIARQRQDGSWEYGVMSWTSANLYGIRETPLYRAKKTIIDSRALLSAALGFCAYNSQPTSTFIFTVHHPRLDTTMVPFQARVGDMLNVHFEGLADGLEFEDDPSSDLYGQYVPADTGTYLKFPAPPYSQKDPKLYYQTRIIEITESYSESGHEAVYTLGHGLQRHKQWMDHLAKQIEDDYGAPPDHKHKFMKGWIAGVPGILSQSPYAYEDYAGHEFWRLRLQSGAYFLTDVPDDRWFGDHQGVHYVANLPDENSVVDFIFQKPTSKIGNLNPGKQYCIFRLAGANSGHKSGFFTTTDGITFTPHGKVFKPKNWRWRRGDYKVEIDYSSGTMEGYVNFIDTLKPDAESNKLYAAWHDVTGITAPGGNIGWHYFQGDGSALVFSVEIHPWHPKGLKRSDGKHRPKSLGGFGGGGSPHADVVYDPTTGDHLTAHAVHDDGTVDVGKQLRIATGHETRAIVAGGLTAGSVSPLTLATRLTPGALKAGVTIRAVSTGADDDEVIVGSVTLDSKDYVLTVTPRAPGWRDNHAGPTTLAWEPFNFHGLGSIFMPPSHSGDTFAGWCLTLGAGPTKIAIHPDGTIRLAGNPFATPDGVVGLQAGGVTGRHLSQDYPYPSKVIASNVSSYTPPAAGKYTPVTYNITLTMSPSQAAAIAAGGWEIALGLHSGGSATGWYQSMGYIGANEPIAGPASPGGLPLYDLGATAVCLALINAISLPDPITGSFDVWYQLIGLDAGGGTHPGVDVYLRWAGLTTGD